MTMKNKLLLLGLLTTFLSIPTLHAESPDEGGIGGTGIKNETHHRPEKDDRPEAPERIERIERIEEISRPDALDIENATDDMDSITDDEATPTTKD